MMNKVLITGASGFIGKKSALFFLNEGYDVIGWDVSPSEGEFPIFEVDMTNKSVVTQTLIKHKPDIIIHCAGSSDVAMSVKYPDNDYVGNVTITHNLLFALHELKMEKVRIVYLSSAGVYGNPVQLPITEDMELNPVSPYAVHKVMCEELCKFMAQNYSMNVKVARIFSAFGKGLRKQIFWDMYNKSKEGKLSMLGNGSESRDYIHIDDVVKAIFLLATTESEYLFFNVANGEEISIRTVTEKFAQLVGIEQEMITFSGHGREGDPINWRADISRLEGIGYKKSVEFSLGLKDYIEWCGKQNEDS